jgi:hypothetical protein
VRAEHHGRPQQVEVELGVLRGLVAEQLLELAFSCA